MAKLRSVCVYCGSGRGLDPAFAEAAEQLGRDLAQAGLRLVYGGGAVGLMGILARSALDSGGEVTGIIPHFLQRREQLFEDVTELVVTDDMHQRKMLMFERADAFVALPGGVGTLEELVEQMTWAQLGRHAKPVLIANINRYWDPLIALLERMRTETFIRPGLHVSCLVAETCDEIVPMLEAAAAKRPQTALDATAEAEPIRRM
ncbi:TIGR00730 family Rossman fold protein [Propylenella binzhouense]|uniref:Cytokinin riboside 5'-monophosphate phosphoribohydrolase n=1 Tax=Propylenella binzhouense TaxID=2555902 RepID=A0A964T2V0_9HYPH|nr:TIGR00730 family Rossman fold protein [Propylenella binzhouense]MYZ47471.1 TIGR00730 family Rossman fold protein [Propylenella binzhouense]